MTFHVLDEVLDDYLGPGPECFSCHWCGPPAAREPCRLLASGKPEAVLRAWEYRYLLASDPNALCPEHNLGDAGWRK